MNQQVGKFKNSVSVFLRNTDWLLLLCSVAASVYGIVLIYSSAVTEGLGAREYLIQVAAVAAGLIAALVISVIDYEIIGQLWPILAVVSLVLMILTFTPLGLTVLGAEEMAWLNIPGLNVTFQPSELMKIVFIITFSVHLNRVKDSLNRLRSLVPVLLHGALPVALVIFQHENGTAIVLAGMIVFMLILAGLHPIYLVLGATGAVACIPLVWPYISQEKQGRLLCIIPGFVEKYLQDEGWQQDQALRAIGSGKLWGVGYLEGGQTNVFARNNDFIFSVAGEEFGFFGATLLLTVLALVLLALLRILLKARDFNGMLICGGVMAMIGIQTFINIGMNLRLLPVIGITLPFFSRGGSSVATLLLGIGLALSVFNSSRTRQNNTIFSQRY